MTGSFYLLVLLTGQQILTGAIPLQQLSNPNYNKNWSDLKEKAKTFGQTDSERQEVATILNRVGEILEERNVDYVRNISDFTESVLTSSASHVPRSNGINESIKKQLNYYATKGIKFLQRNPGRFLDEDPDSEVADADNIGKYFEGDIVLTPDQAVQLLDEVQHGNDKRRKRKFIRSNNYKWDHRSPIEYSFDGSHSDDQRKLIKIAIDHWSNITCLNFKETKTPPLFNRIIFTDVDGCASNVGRDPFGEPQFVSIGVECMRLGVIAHEIAHALGFWHEQSRPDRDKHVSVQWYNVAYGQTGQFTKELQIDVDTAGIPYDYGSIMHYRGQAFVRSDDSYTIKTNIPDYQNTIGQRDQLSFYDIKLMNSMYCSDTCKVTQPCQRGGYTDPRHCDRCRCPDGFTGKFCERVMPGYDAHCGGVVHVTPYKFVEVTSPNYPDLFVEGQECSWLVKAPLGMKVELTFLDEFDLFCKEKHSLCMDYVEVKNSSDFANTGIRFCCNGRPKNEKISDSNEMLILFRSFYKRGKGFRARLRAVELSGVWEEWQEWSQCSASCGGCGEKIRRRKCQNGLICSGSAIEREPCNIKVCSYCTVPQRQVIPCGFGGLFRCEKLSAKFASCGGTNQCCAGFTANNNECVKDLSQLSRRKR